jgi:hypothetical protein
VVPFWLPAQFRQARDQLAKFHVRRQSALSINWAERYWLRPLSLVRRGVSPTLNPAAVAEQSVAPDRAAILVFRGGQ